MIAEKGMVLVVVLDALFIDVRESFLDLFRGWVLWRGSFSSVRMFSGS
jgi:hypothetical protein